MVLINTTKITPPNKIENTIESREARSLERELLVDFNVILDFIRDNFDFKSSNYVLQLERIREITYNQTYSLIRHYYQQAYQIGTDYVNDIFVISSFLTHSDMDIIVKQSEDFTNRFYGRLFKVLKKGNQEFYKSLFNTGVKKQWNITNPSALINDEQQIEVFAKQLEQSSSYLYTSLAILIITEALNHATIEKTRKLSQPELKPSPQSSTMTLLQAAKGKVSAKMLKEVLEEEKRDSEQNLQESYVTPFFVFPFGNTIPQETRPQLKNKTVKNIDVSKMKYKWVTREDEKVCPICSALNNNIFTLNDNIPTIPDDTHFNCRCRIVPVSGSEITIQQ